MDYFTNWLDAYAIPNRDTSKVTDTLVTNVFPHFGILMEVYSDQGRNFESRLMQEVLQQLPFS
jgi:hypothetical protein